MKMVKDTQGTRILRVLADGLPHTVADIHRRAGYSRLNSRVSELRKSGHNIICEKVPGRTGSRGYRYTWLNPTPGLTMPVLQSSVVQGPPALVNDDVPRTLETRYRIYCVPRYGEQTLIGTAATPAEVGVKLCEMGAKGQLEGCVVGVLDTHGVPKEEQPGDWLWNPHEGRW